MRTLPERRASAAAFALTLAILGMGLCQPVQAKIIEFDPPGSDNTLPTAINDSRWITGSYSDSGGTHGFLRTPDGTTTIIDVQGATCGTYVWSINRSGVIVGEGAHHSGG